MTKCAERIREEFQERMKDIRKLWALYFQDPDAQDPELGSIYDYGLCFDFVPATDREPGYFRWQLSWGGPADEFRFYTDPQLNVYRIEYVFLDWFDGASLELRGQNWELLEEIWETLFRESGAAEAALEQTQE